MSDPIRYTGKFDSGQFDKQILGSPHWEHPDGEWVKWDDYASLKAEVERLRASSFVTAVPSEKYEKLKAEVERLRKAGNAMYEELLICGVSMEFMGGMTRGMVGWNSAKDGKPTK